MVSKEDKIVWYQTFFHIPFLPEWSELHFKHVGLVPTFECYGGCSGAWGYYVNDSLRSLIATGKGQPNPEE